MIDYDLLVKIGWTALLGWNLRETVANGKELVRLKEKVENGLTSGLKRLGETIEEIEGHIAGEEKRILQAVQRNPKLRTRKADRRYSGGSGDA
jgi:hypothetical protein